MEDSGCSSRIMGARRSMPHLAGGFTSSDLSLGGTRFSADTPSTPQVSRQESRVRNDLPLRAEWCHRRVAWSKRELQDLDRSEGIQRPPRRETRIWTAASPGRAAGLREEACHQDNLPSDIDPRNLISTGQSTDQLLCTTKASGETRATL